MEALIQWLTLRFQNLEILSSNFLFPLNCLNLTPLVREKKKILVQLSLEIWFMTRNLYNYLVQINSKRRLRLSLEFVVLNFFFKQSIKSNIFESGGVTKIVMGIRGRLFGMINIGLLICCDVLK